MRAVNAQAATATVYCEAHGCTREAEPDAHFCDWHAGNENRWLRDHLADFAAACPNPDCAILNLGVRETCGLCGAPLYLSDYQLNRGAA